MSAFIVICVQSIHDQQGMAEYLKQVAPVVLLNDSLKIVAGPKVSALEGGPFESGVILEFPDIDAARNWYYSEEYQSVASLRLSATSGVAFIIESAQGR